MMSDDEDSGNEGQADDGMVTILIFQNINCTELFFYDTTLILK